MRFILLSLKMPFSSVAKGHLLRPASQELPTEVKISLVYNGESGIELRTHVRLPVTRLDA